MLFGCRSRQAERKIIAILLQTIYNYDPVTHIQATKGRTMANRGHAMGRLNRMVAGMAALLYWGVTATVPLVVGVTLAAAAESMHTGIEKYEGSKTCLECHDTLGKEVAESLHYRASGEAQNLADSEKGKPAGMLAGTCQPGLSAAGTNWLTLIKTKEGSKEPVAAGCALCHA